jgi:hypothetical protein
LDLPPVGFNPASIATSGIVPPMTIAAFRRLALAFPETSESEHMGHPDFRVGGKIFATIWPKEIWGMVKLTPQQQSLFVEAEPATFVPVKGGWGRCGATHVRLKRANPAAVHSALVAAWLNVAPKRLVAQFDARD